MRIGAMLPPKMLAHHFTTHDAAQFLRVNPVTVGKWIDRGFLKAYRTPGGHRRILGADLRRFLVEREMPVPAALDAGAALKLIVVDDEQPVLNAIRRTFKSFGRQVELTMTTSGVEALLLLAETKPDAMLIDVNMPQFDGFEVCRKVAAYLPLAQVKVVLMSALPRPEVRSMAFKAGAFAFLAKPVSAKDVIQLLRPAEFRSDVG
jgi:excisionase family DNA binding protein